MKLITIGYIRIWTSLLVVLLINHYTTNAALFPQNDPKLGKPTIRYTVWSKLTTSAIVAAEALGYTETLWNNRGTAPIEEKSYETIRLTTPNKIDDVTKHVTELGFIEVSWDCYQNHYEDYDYDELVDEGVAGYYALLGWDEIAWKFNIVPEYDDYDWSELSAEQQDAAFHLCFNKDVWDGIALADNAFCFSGQNFVEVKDKGIIRMDELQIGDHVKTDGSNFSPVISFSHIDHQKEAEFLQIYANGLSQPLEISKDHMMYTVNDNIIRAKDIQIGDEISNNVFVQTINIIKRNGFYSPVTLNGDIIVSGIRTSNFVALLNYSPKLQHMIAYILYAPLRLVCTNINFNICEQESYTDDGHSNYSLIYIQTIYKLTTYSSFIQMILSILAVTILSFLYGIEMIINNPISTIVTIVTLFTFIRTNKNNNNKNLN